MKKIGLLLFVVVMALGAAGCFVVDDLRDADPVGTWTMTNDWGCDGSMDTFVWHIHPNETFISSAGNNGSWKVDGQDITLNYANGTIYGGRIDDDRMSGTMTAAGSGEHGCWSATRTSTTP